MGDGVVIKYVIENDPHGHNKMLNPTCDHGKDDMKKYTVQEGEYFTIKTYYKKSINYAKCYGKGYEKAFETTSELVYRNETVYTAVKEMGTEWDCSFHSLRNISNIMNNITVNYDTFANTVCSMKLHIRRKEAPLVILVNNMAMFLIRSPLSEAEADFTTVYTYELGDVVNIISVAKTYSIKNTLNMKCPYLGEQSNQFIETNFDSNKIVGIKTTLTSLHDGKYCLFTIANQLDYSTVRLRFIQKSDPMKITINGLTIRPRLENRSTLLHVINYKYKSNSRIDVICETTPKYRLKFRCTVDSVDGPAAQICDIQLRPGDMFLNQTNLMEMSLPANQTVLELHADNWQKIYYEYDADEVLVVKCSVIKPPLNVIYMHFEKNSTTDKNIISKIVHLNSESEKSSVVCYLKDQVNDEQKLEHDEVMYTSTVIFVKKPYLIDPEAPSTDANQEIHDPDSPNSDANTVSVSNQVPYEGSPQCNNYENLSTPSESSIPPYPAQWEANNYAVPVDHRQEEPAYSVPIQPLYTEPVPKNARKLKQNQVGPTYAILNIKAKQKRNIIKDTNDPNYSEVFNRNYANVAKESPYVNAEEPMYCEANVASKNQNPYTNVHNSPYANSSAQEYVEPTYCEPQRRK
ncbi:hypothetical protein HW555_007505 [Spodoptera exigua]|uniref:Uncharacterized protein n=1 Tax=Spodoptera exigua TaxID=7107 RepID=A0A835L8U1_SPOEX|nr:hypothetical protein HW555_007505 [Spodoptera exigua]